MAERRVALFFAGTGDEFRAWLAQLSTLVGDERYEWELTASIARHPAGKRLRRWDGCRLCGSDGPLHFAGCSLAP